MVLSSDALAIQWRFSVEQHQVPVNHDGVIITLARISPDDDAILLVSFDIPNVLRKSQGGLKSTRL